MLPFLKEKNKSIADVVVAERRPTDDSEPEDGPDTAGLEAAAHDLINAVHSKDAKAVAAALKAAIELADIDPTSEDPA